MSALFPVTCLDKGTDDILLALGYPFKFHADTLFVSLDDIARKFDGFI